jgi:hypothetical protein
MVNDHEEDNTGIRTCLVCKTLYYVDLPVVEDADNFFCSDFCQLAFEMNSTEKS